MHSKTSLLTERGGQIKKNLADDGNHCAVNRHVNGWWRRPAPINNVAIFAE